MFIVAIAFVAFGYALVYWGSANAVLWMPKGKLGPDVSSLNYGTSAPPLAVLVGVKKAEPNNGTIPTHAVPFPYAADADGNKVIPQYNPPSGTGNSGNTNTPPAATGGKGGAYINPNYPGGNINIPTPGIPGIPSQGSTPGRYGTTRPI